MGETAGIMRRFVHLAEICSRPPRFVKFHKYVFFTKSLQNGLEISRDMWYNAGSRGGHSEWFAAVPADRGIGKKPHAER